MAGRAGMRPSCRSRFSRRRCAFSCALALGRHGRFVAKPRHRRDRLCSPRHGELVDVRGVNSFYHYNAIQTWRVNPDGKVAIHVA